MLYTQYSDTARLVVQVKARCLRSQKLARLAGQRTRRMARDMVLFWKKMDKETAEIKKQEVSSDFLRLALSFYQDQERQGKTGP